MDEILDKLRSQPDLGKHTVSASYFHTSALPSLPEEIIRRVERAKELAAIKDEDFSVIKLDQQGGQISLLSYPRFFEDGFPALETSWTVDLDEKTSNLRDYSREENPPILHRKHLLLTAEHPAQNDFANLSQTAEEHGLLATGGGIGRLLPWQGRLARAGLKVVGNKIRSEAPSSADPNEDEVHRHRTAMTRYALSSPMQTLWRLGLLDGSKSVFDYGCGRGDDLRILSELGVEAAGWDPYFQPDGVKANAKIVNLGFVLNVIESRRERAEAIEGAWGLCDELLIVACILGDLHQYEKHRIYKDGVLTSRGTFQKYFLQKELREYLSKATGETPIPAGPGIFLIFKGPEIREKFLADQLTGRHSRPGLGLRGLLTPRRPRQPRPNRWEEHADLIEDFWDFTLAIGRKPEPGEYARESEIREKLGTINRVLSHQLQQEGEDELRERRDQIRNGLLVYFALAQFEKKQRFSELPPSLQRDVKSIWGSHATALTEARDLLLSAGDPEAILNSARDVAESGTGYLDESEGLYLRTAELPILPNNLRILAGCAQRIFGDLEGADLCKFHLHSRKFSLYWYEDFEYDEFPIVRRSVKILLAQNDFIDSLGSLRPRRLALSCKSRFMNPDTPEKEIQSNLEKRKSEMRGMAPRFHEDASSASPKPKSLGTGEIIDFD